MSGNVVESCVASFAKAVRRSGRREKWSGVVRSCERRCEGVEGERKESVREIEGSRSTERGRGWRGELLRRRVAVGTVEEVVESTRETRSKPRESLCCSSCELPSPFLPASSTHLFEPGTDIDQAPALESFFSGHWGPVDLEVDLEREVGGFEENVRVGRERERGR